MTKFGLYLLTIISFLGCRASHQPQPGISDVQIISTIAGLEHCKFLGEIVSSEGVWYNYWFISN